MKVMKVWVVITEPSLTKDVYNYEKESKGGSLAVFRTRRSAKAFTYSVGFAKVVEGKLMVELEEETKYRGKNRSKF